MKLATLETGGKRRVVTVVGEEAVDLTHALGMKAADVQAFLSLGPEGRALAERCVKAAKSRLPLQREAFRSPVLRPEKILGVGMNYRSFVAAAQRIGLPMPTRRVWFYRPYGCLTGAYGDVWLPRDARDLEYEAELVVVIGRSCRYVSAKDAPKVIAGFTIANDVTMRERVVQVLVFGKSFDTHTPLGPWIVTPEDIENVHALEIKTWLNGELRQHGNTSDMIANCYELIAEVSSICTLNPGDLILTGTPDGCGVFQRPPSALRAGDVVKIQIEGIGVIENRIVDEPPLSAAATQV